MTKYLLLLSTIFAFATLFESCSKNPSEPTVTPVTEAEVLNDFASDLANPNYVDLNTKAAALNTAVITLDSSTTIVNLAAAQASWRSARTSWEEAEGFLFGPVEDFNYDPSMDTWPVDKTELDSLLASSNPLSTSDIDSLPESLKGFHAIEYVLFASGGSRTPAQLNARLKLYLGSLATSLYQTTSELRVSWDPSQPNNFTAQFVTAGSGSARYPTKKDAFLAVAAAMSDICNEVANEKMETPFLAQDSTLDESAFSHNSTADFKSNITGVQHAYLSKYFRSGHSLSELVAEKNAALDNAIKAQLSAAISSFDALTPNFETAIYTEQPIVHSVQAAVNTLKSTLDNQLTAFIQTNVKD